MGQLGCVRKTTGRTYQSYESLMMKLHAKWGSNEVDEWSVHHKQLTADAAAEVSNKGTTPESIALKGNTPITLVIASNTDDNAYDTKTVTIHYLDVNGVAQKSVATYDPDNTTTEVAFIPAVTDFYCWDPAYGLQAVVSSVAVQAGDTVCIGATGCVAGIADPDIAFCTIVAGRTYPTATTMWGVGDISEDTAANAADDTITGVLTYLTPWGQLKHGTWTIPADSSASVRLISTEDTATAGTTIYVGDYYRTRTCILSAAAIDEIRLGNDDATVIYGVIDIGNRESVHSRFMALGTAYGQSYFGEIYVTFPSVADVCTVAVTYTPKGDMERTVSFDSFLAVNPYKLYPIQLEPLSDFSVTIEDGNVAHAYANVTLRMVEHEV